MPRPLLSLIAGVLTVLGGLLGAAESVDAQPALSVVWRARMHDLAPMAWQPRNPASAVLSADRKVVYLSGADGLHALQATNGKSVWHAKTGEALAGTPLAHGKLLYTITRDGRVQALDATTGKGTWEKPVELGAVVQAGLASDDTRLFAVSDPGTVTAIRRADGKILWRHGRSVVREFLVEGHGAATVSKDVVYAGLADGNLVALAARDGGSIWQVQLGDKSVSPYVDVDTTPVLAGAGRDGIVLATSHNGGLHAVTLDQGEIKWRYRASGPGQPYVTGKRVYSVAPEGVLHVVRLADGKRVFARRIAGSPYGTLAFMGDVVLVPGATGLQVIGRNDGRGVSRIVDEFGFSAAPLIDGDRIFALSNGGLGLSLRLRELF